MTGVSLGDEYWIHPDAYMTMVRPVYVLKGRASERELSDEDQVAIYEHRAGFVGHF